MVWLDPARLSANAAVAAAAHAGAFEFLACPASTVDVIDYSWCTFADI